MRPDYKRHNRPVRSPLYRTQGYLRTYHGCYDRDSEMNVTFWPLGLLCV